LASPLLVVAYAIAGNTKIDITKDVIGTSKDGKPVYLKDIWPTNKEIADTLATCLTREMFIEKYSNVFAGDKYWQAVKTTKGDIYEWDANSTYVQHPPYFTGGVTATVGNIIGANILALLGDSITTDHISPAGNIAAGTPAAKYLEAHGVERKDFNSYGARRGSHDVMMRGTFANIRIKNEMAPGTEGGVTTYIPSGEVMAIFDAAERYKATGTPLVIFAGKEYGTGSSRDWAAKGTCLLGVKAVIAESFERIHRSNLVGMGIMPLVFKDGATRQSLKLDGTETISLLGLEGKITPHMDVTCQITRKDGSVEKTTLLCRIDTVDEVAYYEAGGILQYVVGNLTGMTKAA